MSTTILPIRLRSKRATKRRAAGGGFLKRVRRVAGCLACLAALGAAQADGDDSAPVNHVVHRLERPVETLELTVNMSRILTIGKELPRVIVNNPEVAEVTALSPTQIQVMAKKPGVTQINLFSTEVGPDGDEREKIHTVDLIVYPDARELTLVLRTQFPTAALKVVPTANSVIISGYVDNPGEVERIVAIASDYAPKVLNNIKVGGVQQVLLQVKVMEVSRTKLRNMGFDWSLLGQPNQGFATSGVGQLLNTVGGQSGSSGGVKTALGGLTPASGTAQSMTLGVMSGSSQFFGVLNLLTQKSVAKVIAEPELITVSGRPAQFQVGGSIPIPMSGGLGTQNVQWKNFGMQVDFVPIVLGNGAIRLEVRPMVSELDYSNAITMTGGATIPAIKQRQADAGVELRSGQTLALAGLVQIRVETQTSGLIWVSELPLLGIPFRRVSDNYNEVETLILVTPHLVDAIDRCDVPPGGPGFATALPNDHELYCKAHVEVPNCQGGEMLGPYPDAHGVFPPVSAEAWEEPPTKNKPGTAAPSPQPNRQPAEPQTRRPDSGGQQREFVDRPKPPALTGGKSTKMNTAGYVRFDGKEPSSPTKPTVKPGPSRQKKSPGFIGPTGYDLR